MPQPDLNDDGSMQSSPRMIAETWANYVAPIGQDIPSLTTTPVTEVLAQKKIGILQFEEDAMGDLCLRAHLKTALLANARNTQLAAQDHKDPRVWESYKFPTWIMCTTSEFQTWNFGGDKFNPGQQIDPTLKVRTHDDDILIIYAHYWRPSAKVLEKYLEILNLRRIRRQTTLICSTGFADVVERLPKCPEATEFMTLIRDENLSSILDLDPVALPSLIRNLNGAVVPGYAPKPAPKAKVKK